ncbi:hypothetical protein [Bacillus cereus]|uniref:hypothetical protein n=1 Tax=Bacillus cereus TaxID=1396 RepID=UPI000BFE4E83|nr:hypothetical protein [Bacillus cereus]PGR83733.1 hypothetical protein COC63_07015 [Bacillus cereus]
MQERQKVGRSIKDFLKLGGRMKNRGVLQVNVRKVTRNPALIEVLNKYYTLLVETNFLSGVAYEVLVLGRNRKEVVRKYPHVAETYVRNLVYRDAKRVFAELGCDPYKDIKDGIIVEENAPALNNVLDKLILTNGKKGDARTYEDDLFGTSQSKGMLTDNVQIDFKQYAEIDSEYIRTFRGDEEFRLLAKRFQILSKPYFDNFMRDTDKRLVGYFMFLLNTDDDQLTEKQKIQKEQLKQVWWLHEN